MRADEWPLQQNDDYNRTTIYSDAPPHELDNKEHVMLYVKSSTDQDAE